MRDLLLFFLLWGFLVQVGHSAHLSPLASEPRWEHLHDYQFTITRERFEKLLDEVYSADGGLRSYLRISPESMTLFSDQEKTSPLFSLFFSADDRTARDLPRQLKAPLAPESAQPLQGLRICLDPGHIGGDFSKMEERYFKIGENPSVEEAHLNLITCQILEKKLQKYGAEVVWTKTKEEPVTSIRPDQLREEALRWIFDLGASKSLPIDEEITKRSNILFYRTAEIRSRAERVKLLKPDLTICLHYNAGDWGPDPLNPRLVEKSRLVLFVTGGFMANELKYDDQKYDLLQQLLEQSHEIEKGLSSRIAAQMKTILKMSPEVFKNWGAVVPIKGEEYLFARNLAANRWFEGPTVFVEGPYMNAKDAYARIIAGDYDGEREIEGKLCKSIFADFATSVAQGVLDYYRTTHFSPPAESKKPIAPLWNP